MPPPYPLLVRVPFNFPQAVGAELEHVQTALADAQLAAGGRFARSCENWLESRTKAGRALLTHSATAALELIALLLDLAPGDEVIMPSFTFVSTGNAVALRGATPVFVDIRADTLNLDEREVEPAVTHRTKAIVAVHYAGVPCEMDALGEIARRRGLLLVEDAAQALLSTYHGRAAGALASASAISFHETKNLHCGEGGAVLVSRDDWVQRAVVLRDKGTNRSRFLRGEVDKYSWVDLGSSFGLGELSAAFLWGQLERADEITRGRRRTWEIYHERFEPLEERGLLRRPIVPPHVQHNAHLYYVLVEDLAARTTLIEELDRRGVHAVFHYVPLHLSPAGLRLGHAHGELPETIKASDRLVRLPLWHAMPQEAVDQVTSSVAEALGSRIAT
jgi:dTDP-4-amino-4,6-dideoxygalactose transaminase